MMKGVAEWELIPGFRELISVGQSSLKHLFRLSNKIER